MKYLLTTIISVISFATLAQERIPCRLDTSQSLHLMWNLEITDTGQIEKLLVTNSKNEDLGQDVTRQECIYGYFNVKFVKSDGQFYTFFDEHVETGSIPEYHLINLKKISQLSISVNYVAEREANKKAFDLSKIEFLKYIDLQNLQSLAINQSSETYDLPLAINLASWPGYSIWSKSNALTELEILTDLSYDKNLLTDILPFKKLKRLYISEYMNEELLNFPDLESVSTSDAMGFFAQHLFELPSLKRFSPIVSYVDCRWHDPYSNYAIQSFFIDALSITSISHPLHAMDSIARTHEGTGTIALLASDWNILRYNKPQKDTLAFGMIVDGKPTRIWKFELFHRHENLGWVTYHYDYDQKERIQFPVSGPWEYHYQDGRLAISGQFLEGCKNGLWKFYNPSGDISGIRNFNKDKMREPSIDYPVATQYEIKEGELDQPRNTENGFVYNKTLSKTAFDHPSLKIGRKRYRFTKKGDLERLKNDKILTTIPLGSAKFCRLVRRIK